MGSDQSWEGWWVSHSYTLLRSSCAVLPSTSCGSSNSLLWNQKAKSLGICCSIYFSIGIKKKPLVNFETMGWIQDSWGSPAAGLEAQKFWAGFPGPVTLRQSAWQSSHKAQLLTILHLLREIDIRVETEKLKYTEYNFTEQLGYGESTCCLEVLYFISWVWGLGTIFLLNTSKCFRLSSEQNLPIS